MAARQKLLRTARLAVQNNTKFSEMAPRPRAISTAQTASPIGTQEETSAAKRDARSVEGITTPYSTCMRNSVQIRQWHRCHLRHAKRVSTLHLVRCPSPGLRPEPQSPTIARPQKKSVHILPTAIVVLDTGSRTFYAAA